MKKIPEVTYQRAEDLASELVVASFYVAMSEPEAPSINALYSTGRHGQRFLTKAGAAFKSALTRAVAEEVIALSWNTAVDAVYKERAYIRLCLCLHVDLYNHSWKPGGRTKGGDLQSPFKSIDGPNYSKAIEDAIADGTGIDDSAHMEVTVRKINGPKHIEIFYEVLRGP